MIKLSSKRGREWNEETTPAQCSPHKILSLDSTPNKRLRGIYGEEMREDTNNSPKRDSPFSQDTHPYNAELDTLVNKTRKKKETSEILFTYEQVREIVNRALAERDATVRAEYDQILQQRLQEQFRNFSKFNEDYISRQYKQNDFSYLS